MLLMIFVVFRHCVTQQARIKPVSAGMSCMTLDGGDAVENDGAAKKTAKTEKGDVIKTSDLHLYLFLSMLLLYV